MTDEIRKLAEAATQELLKRLKAKVERSPYVGFKSLVNPDGPEAAKIITSQTAELTALRAKVKALEDAARPPEQWTYGHCRENAKPGGCQLHNLHCGYPDCDRRAAKEASDAS